MSDSDSDSHDASDRTLAPHRGGGCWPSPPPSTDRKAEKSKFSLPPPPPCDIPSGCCFFTGPWTVTRSSLRMLRPVAAFCRPLRPVYLPVSCPRSRSPEVWCAGGCAGVVFRLLLPSPPPHSGRPPPASLCFRGHVVRRVAVSSRGPGQTPVLPFPLPPNILLPRRSVCGGVGRTTTPRPPCNPSPNVRLVPPKGGGDGHKVTVPPKAQFQRNLKKKFLRRLRRLVFPMLFGPSKGGRGHLPRIPQPPAG